MSDPGDKTRRDGGRGPLPRSNRPRPEAARRGFRDRDGAEAAEAAEPADAQDVTPPTVREAQADATKRGLGDNLQNETRQSGVIEEAPPRSVVGKEDAKAGVLPDRPTQLAPAESGITRISEPLKQVALERADGSVAPLEEVAPLSTYVGCLVDGRYRIDGVLGRGGMGVVYRARHEVIDKLAAIKILLPTEDGDVVERFVNEARAATAIGNAHIVDTVDFGTLPDGSTYFVMEYLEGQTLAHRIKEARFIAIPRALAIAKQIAEGMDAAHRAGIVHRDLKPENIFLTPRDGAIDFVKLLDFGIAKVASAQNRITRAGTIFGTPHYMSPEQASGSEVDPRTDIYSLGVILYEMVSGRVPFDAENPMGLLTQHLYTEPTPLCRLESMPQPVPSSVDAVVLKCLEKKPEHRYASMDALAADLVRVERGEPPSALADLLARAERIHDTTLIEAARRGLRETGARRRSGLSTGAIAAVTVLAIGAAGLVIAIARGDARQHAPAAPAIMAPAEPTDLSLAGRSVALVFSPIDAEVFRDGKSLGGMPVTVALAAGETVTVEIRREGFYPETVRLDGSRSVVVVRLAQIPGVEPRIPVPAGEPLEVLRRAQGVGAHPMPLVVEHQPAVAARTDAGAPAAKASPPSAPAAMTPPTPIAPATAAKPQSPATVETPPPSPPAASGAAPAPAPPPSEPAPAPPSTPTEAPVQPPAPSAGPVENQAPPASPPPPASSAP